MRSRLSDELIQYRGSDAYPFHMPGHKRNMKGHPFADSYDIDVTEIDGFDNLHKPEGIILEAERRAAFLYGSSETHFLVNGSTGGILSAVAGTAGRYGKIILAANSHKAAFHTLILNQLKSEFVYPSINVEYGIAGGIPPQEVKKLLERDSDIQAVFLTSPTYDGMISSVREIADIVHSYGIPLIVDEAHGAHFGFYKPLCSRCGMVSSIQAGADVVIHSVHKTLPSYTQTALIHLNGDLVDREKIRRYLSVYQTSSPSYLLMGGIDRCMGMLEADGQDLFAKWEENLDYFHEIRKELSHLRVAGSEVIGTADIAGRDIGKLLISSRNTTGNGHQVYDILRERYHLQLEMAAGSYCVAISTIMDSREGLGRLRSALLEIDSELHTYAVPDICADYRHQEKVYEIYEAFEQKPSVVSFEHCSERIAADFIYVYPPGIPLVVPGEKMERPMIRFITELIRKGLNVTGVEEGKFKVL